MIAGPPPYPRIPHLIAGRGSRDDLVLGRAEVNGLLTDLVVVEEKLDGANVVVWRDATGKVDCAGRGGPGAMDRARQLGPLRAWVAAHDTALRAVLNSWPVLYGEWLLLTHTVAYRSLPSYLVVLDLWREGDGFAGVDERNSSCTAAGLITPPEVWRGVARSVEQIETLLCGAAWSDQPMEGLVVRRVGEGEPRLAKLVRPGWEQLGDKDWRSGRPHNRLAAGEVSWR